MDEQDKCTVIMDGVKEESEDYVAILTKHEGDVEIIYNADALTLGMGLKLIAATYLESLEECNEEDRTEIINFLKTYNILKKRPLMKQILDSIPFLEE